jgi:hypothetical protein
MWYCVYTAWIFGAFECLTLCNPAPLCAAVSLTIQPCALTHWVGVMVFSEYSLCEGVIKVCRHTQNGGVEYKLKRKKGGISKTERKTELRKNCNRGEILLYSPTNWGVSPDVAAVCEQQTQESGYVRYIINMYDSVACKVCLSSVLFLVVRTHVSTRLLLHLQHTWNPPF